MPIYLHCWEPGPENEDGCSTTCIKKLDHVGKHEWTPDDEIRFTFTAPNSPYLEWMR